MTKQFIRQCSYVIAGLAILLSAGGCAHRPSLVAQVGISTISDRDIRYRQGMEKVYGQRNVDDTEALVELVEDALELEVGRLAGIQISSQDINNMRQKQDASMPFPEVLAGIKKVFAGDEPAYERLYLVPRIINSKLLSWYSHHAVIHRKARKKIECGYALLEKGSSLSGLAEKCQLEYSTKTYDAAFFEPPDDPAEKKAGGEAGHEGHDDPDDPFLEILRTLQPGEVLHKIIEDESTLRLVRLMEKQGSEFKVEMASSSKELYFDWLQDQARVIRIDITDSRRLRALVARYPSLWWMRK